IQEEAEIERFEFADGVRLGAIELDVDGADNYYGTDSDDIVTGIRADGYKALRLYGEKGDDTLIAAKATLPVGVTDSGSQHLYGRQGNDTYVISKNSGDVRITGFAEEVGMGTDTVRFIDLTLAELSIGLASADPTSKWNGAWHFNWAGEAALLIQEEAEIERFEFADGTSLSEVKLHNDGQLGLVGTEDDDVIFSGSRSETISGSTGSDTFIFAGLNIGTDVITDFVAGAGSEDIIRFDSDVLTDFGAVLAAASDNGSNVIIALDDDNSVTLSNISKSDLHSDDFQFV
ncbi:hypothetical protein SAMN04488518_1151, partial [Pseudovibrio ascidiaceicola]